MGFFSNRRQQRDAQLATTVATAVAQHLASVLTSPKVDLNSALETLVVKKAQSETEGATSSASILIDAAKTMMEYASDSAFRRSRRPGGIKRAATARRKRGAFARNCRLCENPMISNPSIEEILEHAKHGEGAAREIEVTPQAVIAHVEESQIQAEPDGEGERIECDDCGPGAGYNRPVVH